MVRVGYVSDEELDFEAVVIAGDDLDDSIEVQRALTFDDQDRSLGMDTYCLVRGGTAKHYGGIEQWSVTDNVLSIRFTTEAAAALGLATVLNTVIETAARDLVVSHLHRLLS